MATKRIPGTKGLKLSNNEFWETLRECGGLFARTVREVEKKYGIKYTRQAVAARAKSIPELYADIVEQNIDRAEEVVIGMFSSKDEKNRLTAAQFYLKHRGRDRGYAESVKLEHSGEIQQQHFILKIGNAVIPDDRGATTSGAANDMGEPE